MLTAILGAGLIARARQVVSGPLAGAALVAIASIIVVGAIALGLAWLRGDAAQDAKAAQVAICEADKLQAQLDAERARTAALEAAQRARDDTIEMLTRQRVTDEAQINQLVADNGRAIDAAREWERRAGRRVDACLRADDPWLRQGRAASGANRSPRR